MTHGQDCATLGGELEDMRRGAAPEKPRPVSGDGEERLRAVFNTTAVGVALLTPDARFLEVNDAFCRITGYSAEELMSLDCAGLTHPDDVARTRSLIADLLAGRVPNFVVDKRYVRKDDTLIWVHNSVSATRDESGAPRNLVALCQDVTERRHSEMLLAEQNRLLELIASGASLDTCLTTVTSAISRLQSGTRACILLADAERTKFSSAYAAEVPPSFGQGLKDTPINDLAIGTCGEGVQRGEPITCPDIAADKRWSEPWRDLCVAHGILACHSQPVLGSAGLPLASVMLCFDKARAPSEWELQIARFGAHAASVAIERDRSDTALRDTERRLEAELTDTRQLQSISARMIHEDDVDALYREILDAAIAIMRSDFGSMQMLYPERDELKLLAWKGFHPDSAKFWDWVRVESGSSCGQALETGERVIVPDIEACDFIAGTEDFEFYRLSGIAAVQSTPLVSRTGQMLGMISNHWREPHQPSRRDLRLLDVLARQAADLTERRQAIESLRESEERYRHIVESAKEYAIVTLDEAGSITSWNAGAERLLGYSEEEAVGRLGDIFFTPEDREADQPEREMYLARTEGRATNERWHLRKDGSRFWGSGVMLPTFDGEEGSYLKIFRDRTEERAAEERQALLVDELNHRVKNTLAIVQSLAQQTFRGENVADEARRAFEGRLEALASAHNLLTRESWESADLGDVVRDALHACHGNAGQFAIDGPAVLLEPKTAVTVSMALHELCTNAAKYGALSVEGGHVSVTWRTSEGSSPRLSLRWEERGGPAVTAPTRRGFGSRMIERALASELHGDVDLRFAPEGLICEIEAPLPHPAKPAR